jgi:hypothetical protein
MSGHDQASFRQGVRASITWLHEQAKSMNDPHAKVVLNNAAYHLGVAQGGDALRSSQPQTDLAHIDALEAQIAAHDEALISTQRMLTGGA